jgi:hypothetical protein
VTAATDRLRASAARRSPTAPAAGSSPRRAPTPLVLAPALSGILTSGLHQPSRAAVIDATSSRRLDPEHRERVDGERGSQSLPVCRPGAARLANTHALSPSSPADLTGTTTNPSSLTPPSAALAPGLSPRPPRLTPHAPSSRPDESALLGRDRLTLPRSRPGSSDAARIGRPCSAPATPAAREGRARSGASSRAAVTRRATAGRGRATASALTASAAHHLLKSADVGAAHPADVPAAVGLPSLANTSGTTNNLSSFSSYSVSAHDVSQRAPLASAGSSDARTQGGPRSSATWADRGQSSAPIRRRQGCAEVNGVGTEAPAAGRHRRVGLIEQSTRSVGDGFPARPSSIRPAGPLPAGVTT